MNRSVTPSGGRPVVVAVDGVDGAGKSSQCAAVAHQLRARGWAVALSSEVGPLPVRDTYRTLIADHDAFPDARTSVLLGLAAHSHLAHVLRSASVDVVVLDRFVTSVAADALALGMPLDLVIPLFPLFEAPDLQVVIDLDPAVALQRKAGECSVAEAGGPDEILRLGSRADAFVAYQGRVRDALRQLQAVPSTARRVVMIDGTRDRCSVEADVLASVVSVVGTAAPETGARAT